MRVSEMRNDPHIALEAWMIGKKFLVKRSLAAQTAALLALAAVASCGGEQEMVDQALEGRVTVRISGLTDPSVVTSILVEAQPAGTSTALIYEPTGSFSGNIVLPPGEQELTARAYRGADLVGLGSATVTIVTGQTAYVIIKILDTTGPGLPPLDASPVILAVVVSNVAPHVGDEVTLSVEAVDANDDPITYAWSDNCASSTFGAPTAATTTWSSTRTGACTVTITVTANSKADSETVVITAQDAAPVIAALVASNPTPVVDEVITLSVTASDPDNDALAYSWQDDCASSTFGGPTAATTTWSNSSTGACIVTVTVTANGLTASRSLSIPTQAAGTGIASVTGYYVRNPNISGLRLDALGFSCSIQHADGDALCSQSVRRRQVVEATVSYSLGADSGSYTPSLTDSCGSTVELVSSSRTGALFRWTAPANRTVCLLTASVSHEGMTDSFSSAVVVTGCVDELPDIFLELDNDTFRWPWALWAPYLLNTVSGFYAHDDDWFRIDGFNYVFGAFLTLRATSAVGDSLPLALYVGTELVTSGTNEVTFPGYDPGHPIDAYLLHVGPGAGAAACDSPYSLTVIEHN